MPSRCNFSDIDVITDFGTIGTISFGNIAIMQINRNNDKFCFLKDNTNRDYNASITKNNTYFFHNITNQIFQCKCLYVQKIYISFKIIRNKGFLVFKNTRLILSWIYLLHMGKFAKTQILRWKLGKVKLKVAGAHQRFFGAGQVSLNRRTLINTSCTRYKRRAPQGKIFLFFLQDILKPAFQGRV